MMTIIYTPDRRAAARISEITSCAWGLIYTIIATYRKICCKTHTQNVKG